MGFWGDGVYRYDEAEIRDQTDRSWAVAFIVTPAIPPDSIINIFMLVRFADDLADIDDLSRYPNAVIGESYLRIYKNENRTPEIELAMDDANVENVDVGIYKYAWTVPLFDMDAFSIEVTLQNTFTNPATLNYPEEVITVDRTFSIPVGGKSGGVTPVGSEAVSILVRDRISHSPIPDVRASIYNPAGDRLIGYGVTNASGLVVLLGNTEPGLPLDPGVYLVRLAKSLVSFDPTYSITVESGEENDFILKGTEIPVPVPPHPDLCLIHGWLYEINANPYANQKFHVNIYQPPRGSKSGVLLGSGAIKVETDEEGYFSFYAVRGYMIRIDVPQASLEAAVLVPDQESVWITDLVKVG
jgi:hypothetical protein